MTYELKRLLIRVTLLAFLLRKYLVVNNNHATKNFKRIGLSSLSLLLHCLLSPALLLSVYVFKDDFSLPCPLSTLLHLFYFRCNILLMLLSLSLTYFFNGFVFRICMSYGVISCFLCKVLGMFNHIVNLPQDKLQAALSRLLQVCILF